MDEIVDRLISRGTLYEAFGRVRENAGCRGVDGVTVGEFQENLETELDHIQDRLIRRRYHPLPLLQFPVPKSHTGFRNLSVPTVRDRVVQTVVSPMLSNLFLDELDENLALFGQTLVRYADDFLVLCKNPQDIPQALEITDYLLADLDLRLNREKTATTSFEQGFKFLGAIFLKESIFLPFDRSKPELISPRFPPPLDLLSYLELKNLETP